MLNNDDALLAELGITMDDVKEAVKSGVVDKIKKTQRRNGNWWSWKRWRNSKKFKMPPVEDFDKYANVVVAKGMGDLETEMDGFTESQRQTMYNNHLQIMFRYGGIWRRGFIDIRTLLPKIVEMGKMNKDYFNKFYGKKHANK